MNLTVYELTIKKYNTTAKVKISASPPHRVFMFYLFISEYMAIIFLKITNQFLFNMEKGSITREAPTDV